MIDKSSTIESLLKKGYAVAVLAPTTLLTDDMTPLDIAGLEVDVLHKSLIVPSRDSKPWKTSVGVDDMKQARIESAEKLANASGSQVVRCIMSELTII